MIPKVVAIAGVSNCRIVARFCDRSFKTGDRSNPSNIVQLSKCKPNRAIYIYQFHHVMQISFNLSELCQFNDVIYRSIIIDVRLISWCKLMNVLQTICRTIKMQCSGIDSRCPRTSIFGHPCRLQVREQKEMPRYTDFDQNRTHFFTNKPTPSNLFTFAAYI